MADENQMTDAELQKAIDDQTKTGDEPQAEAKETPQEYEIKLATGQVYKGATRDEAEEKLRVSQEEATRTIRDRENQIRTLTAEKLASQQPKQESKDGKFEMEKYHNLLATDPLQAAYYLDSFRPEYRDAIATVETVKRANAAGTFMRRNPDYVDTPENSALLAERLQQEEGNWSNPDHMERAFYGLIRDGKMKREVEPEKPAKPTPPPRLGGVSPATKEIPDDSELYAMDDKTFNDFMTKRGVALPGRNR